MNLRNKVLQAFAVLLCLGVVSSGAGAQTTYTFTTFYCPKLHGNGAFGHQRGR